MEDKISRFHEKEDTILYASCFDANAGLFEQLLGPEDAVLSDALNHASIIDGIRLCKAKKYRYLHKNMSGKVEQNTKMQINDVGVEFVYHIFIFIYILDLEEKLKDSESCRSRLIVTDGVFSMDGNVAPLPEICDLADK